MGGGGGAGEGEGGELGLLCRMKKIKSYLFSMSACLCVIVHVCAHARHTVCVEVRGRLMEVSSPLPPRGLRNQTQLSGLVAAPLPAELFHCLPVSPFLFT